MNFPALSQIEEHIAQLSLDEQLWLIARVGDLQKNKIPYIVEPLTGTSSQVLSTAERFL